MYSQKGKKYIYSVDRANEFMKRGYRCIETGFMQTAEILLDVQL